VDAKGTDGHSVLDLIEYKQRLRVPVHDTTLDRAVHFHRARVLEARGQFDDAIQAYKKVLELAPQDSVAYARLANLYVQRGAPRAAVVVYVALAEMQAEAERWEKAALAYEKAAELARDDSEVHTALRDVYIKLGRLRDASKVQDRIDGILKEIETGEIDYESLQMAGGGDEYTQPMVRLVNALLVDAVKRQDVAAVTAQLKRRADVSARQPDGATALHWAAHHDDLTIVDLLVRAAETVLGPCGYDTAKLHRYLDMIRKQEAEARTFARNTGL